MEALQEIGALPANLQRKQKAVRRDNGTNAQGASVRATRKPRYLSR
jgi:hypothetical protein